MKRVGLTQRVDIIAEYGERRDALDQKWHSFLLAMEMLPIPLPNLAPDLVGEFVESLRLDAVVLTGGNSLCHLDKSASDIAPERDSFELALIDYALKRSIPIFGVCRGMQIINHYFGGDLVKVDGHVGKLHRIESVHNDYIFPKLVNSYHNWTIPEDGLADDLIPLAVDDDGNVEAFRHTNKNIIGITWHPERVFDFKSHDLTLFKRVLL
ncbi:gamma-glutamyl-gamma-aminobutyrate hydrolase family protein [Pseudomonadota bacterium]